MIKIMECENTDLNFSTYKIVAFADTKEEVTPSAEIIGLPKGASIEMGSTMFTASGEIAYMKSNGNWNWI